MTQTHSASLTPLTLCAHVAEPGNRIGAAGARALADGIKDLKGLEELSLGGECVIACCPSPTVAHDIHTRLVGVGMVGRVVYVCEC